MYESLSVLFVQNYFHMYPSIERFAGMRHNMAYNLMDIMGGRESFHCGHCYDN